MNNPPEVNKIIDKFGKASIFSFAVYDEISDEDIFVLSKGIYIACRINNSDLPEDFEKYLTIVEAKEDRERASLFCRTANTNLNVILGGSFVKKDVEFLAGLLKEGLDHMKVENEYIGFFEVESNV